MNTSLEEIGPEGVDSVHFPQDIVQCGALVNMVRICWVL
jgi:hypothetical protein